MLTATWTKCLQRHELITCMSEFSLYTSGTDEELRKRFASYIVDHWHDRARKKRLLDMQNKYCRPPSPRPSEKEVLPTVDKTTVEPSRPLNNTGAQSSPATSIVKRPPLPIEPEVQLYRANTTVKPSPTPPKVEINIGEDTKTPPESANCGTQRPTARDHVQAPYRAGRDIRPANAVRRLRVDDEHILADITIGGVVATAILDTGSTRSFMNYQFVERLGVPIMQANEVVEITLADGTVVEVDEVVETDVSLGNVRCKLQFIIMPNAEEVLLGLDFCIRGGVTFSCGGETIQLGRTLGTSKPEAQVAEFPENNLAEFKSLYAYLGEIDDETLREVRQVVSELTDKYNPGKRRVLKRVIRGQDFKFTVSRTGVVRPYHWERRK